jgi:hypothetical protein
VLASGCRQETTAADYQQSCSEDADCVTIHSGDWCPYPYCQCDNAAINRTDETRYREDARSVSCGPDILPVDCAACSPTEAFCRSAKCEIRGAEESPQ